jgi:FdrA protein
VVLALVGPGRPTLTSVAADVATTLGRTFDPPTSWTPSTETSPRPGPLLGLFSGGTNCVEALGVLEDRIGPVRSNVHPDPARRIGPDAPSAGAHVLLDLGDDELTVGRPHPMLDPATVAERLAVAAATGPADGPGVVLLDVVLGHGAHPDPAAVLAPAVAGATRAGIPVVVTLVGTAGDPQGLDCQAHSLVAAGATVHRSNASAAHHAADLVAAVRSST